MISNTPRFDPKPNIPKDSHDMYIVYLYNHETLLHLQHVSIRWMIIFVFFSKKNHAGILAKSYENFLSPTPWRFKLLKKTPPNCWGTDPVVEVFLLVHPPPPPKTPIWIGIQNPYSVGNSFLVETILKKTTRFQRFFCSPGTLRNFWSYFLTWGNMFVKGLGRKTAKTRKLVGGCNYCLFLPLVEEDFHFD